MKKKIIVPLLLIVVAVLLIGGNRLCNCQGAAYADKALEALAETHGNIGIAAAVVKDGEIIYTGTVGYKDLETQEPLEATDLFRIASVSKSFTATAIMQLIQEGVLSLDDDVSDLIGFPVRNPNFPDTPITLRMILSHTSSMSDKSGYFSLKYIDPKVSGDCRESFNDYAPGTNYEYCNLGYNLAGSIVERLTDTRFDVAIRNRVIRPLGLNAGHNVDSLNNELFVSLYTCEDGKFNKSAAYASTANKMDDYQMGYTAPIFSPTGGVKISAVDLAKYMTMHLQGGVFENTRILDEASEMKMREAAWVYPNLNGDAYGFALETYKNLIPGKTLVGHTGNAYGLYSVFAFCPEENWGIVAITNGCKAYNEDSGDFFTNDAVRRLYESLLK